VSGAAYALPPEAQVGRIALPDRGELAYEERGAGPPIVFLHSSIADRAMWRPTIARLADRYRCVAIDLRGFGDSSLPRERFSDHEDLRAACAALRVVRPVLVGSSYGGRAALDTAIIAPSLPSGVVAIAAGAGGWTYGAEVQAFYAELPEIAGDEGPEAAVDAEITFWVLRGRPRASLDPDALAYLRAAIERARGLAWDRSLRDSIETLARLDAIAVPASIVLGAYDLPDFGAIGERLQAGIGDAVTLSVPAGHLVPIEAPDAVAAAIDALARRASAQR
jgi:pimeloyl-ACP methyl ester carboxylesterase